MGGENLHQYTSQTTTTGSTEYNYTGVASGAESDTPMSPAEGLPKSQHFSAGALTDKRIKNCLVLRNLVCWILPLVERFLPAK